MTQSARSRRLIGEGSSVTTTLVVACGAVCAMLALAMPRQSAEEFLRGAPSAERLVEEYDTSLHDIVALRFESLERRTHIFTSFCGFRAAAR